MTIIKKYNKILLMVHRKYQPFQRLFSTFALFLFLGIGSVKIHAIDSLLVGFGPEVNAYSRRGVAIGTNFIFGMEFDNYFTTGLKTGFFNDLDTVSVWNFQLLIRYYLSLIHSSLSVNSPFVQIETGGIIANEFGETFQTFSAGVSVGWRHVISRNWYIIPAVRFGYPHIWGINLTAGHRFRLFYKEQNNNFYEIKNFVEVEAYEIQEEHNENNDHNESVAMPFDLRVPPVYFSANAVDFEGLGTGIIENNTHALELITQILNTFSNYRVIIEGHANPTTPYGDMRTEEEPELLRISEERAQWAFDELVNRGIDPSRLYAVSFGSSRPIIPFTDNRNAWQNRRVVFILIREPQTKNNELLIEPLTGENNEE